MANKNSNCYKNNLKEKIAVGNEVFKFPSSRFYGKIETIYIYISLSDYINMTFI